MVYAALEDIDVEVDRFAAELADAGELDDILWIFTADHGMASTENPINEWVDGKLAKGHWIAPNMRCLLVEDELAAELQSVDWVDKIAAHDACAALGLGVPEDRTLICLNPGFGYHGAKPEMANHGGLTETERRVPLVLSGLGVKPGQSAVPVETIDIAPTIAEVLGGAWLDTLPGGFWWKHSVIVLPLKWRC